MYFKVALLISALALAGCTNSTTPKPKPAETPKPQEVMNIEENNTTIIPIEEEKIVETVEKDKYNFKPEPFSLKSEEEDPELLGPQTTLDRDALNKRDDEDSDESKNSKAKKPSKRENKEA